MIYIHIGMAKAGSTSLQSYMAQNAPALQAKGVVYPTIGRSRGQSAHHELAWSLGKRTSPAAWDGAVEFFGKERDKTIVISSEGFEAIDPTEVRAALAGFDVKVLCYVRDTTSRVPSFYAHMTKYGRNQKDFDSFFEDLRTNIRPKWLYSKFLGAWASAFGVENVRARSLELSSLINGNLIDDFLSNFGLEVSDFPSDVKAREWQNPSPGWRTVEILRNLHAGLGAFGTPSHAAPVAAYFRNCCIEAQKIGNEMGWVDKGAYLSRSQKERLVELYNFERSKIEELGLDAKVAPLSLDPSYERPFLPDASHIPTAEVAEFMMRFMPVVSTRTIRTFMQRRL